MCGEGKQIYMYSLNDGDFTETVFIGHCICNCANYFTMLKQADMLIYCINDKK